jgi:hypothetical protein
MQELVDRLALVLGEHVNDGDELHVTYNAMDASGWHRRAGRARIRHIDLRGGPGCASPCRCSTT